jgi:hypothetical protein
MGQMMDRQYCSAAAAAAAIEPSASQLRGNPKRAQRTRQQMHSTEVHNGKQERTVLFC